MVHFIPSSLSGGKTFLLHFFRMMPDTVSYETCPCAKFTWWFWGLWMFQTVLVHGCKAHNRLLVFIIICHIAAKQSMLNQKLHSQDVAWVYQVFFLVILHVTWKHCVEQVLLGLHLRPLSAVHIVMPHFFSSTEHAICKFCIRVSHDV